MMTASFLTPEMSVPLLRCDGGGCSAADCVGHGDKCPRRVGGGIVFQQRKGKGKLTLHCPPVLLHLLKEHRKEQTVERLRAGSAWTDYDLVFATRHGGPIERTEDWRSWKAILRQAQVRDVRVHDAGTRPRPC